MKTINLNEFSSDFMDISEKLTLSEVRMLYLLITDPDVIKISQQVFASKIGAHRRTINIGYKKLLKHGYISDPDINKQQRSDIVANITNEQVDDTNFISADIKNTQNNRSIRDNKIKKENNGNITKNKNSGSSNLDAEEAKDLTPASIPYDQLRQDILVYKQYGRIPQFFEKFPNKRTEILIDMNNNLPEFIDFLSCKYGFEEELRILNISNTQIKELKKNILHKEKLCDELSRDYIKYFRQERKKRALQVIRQALIYYPFTFKKFLYDIRAYKYDDLDEIVQAMIKEIYKTNALYEQDGIV